MKHSSLLGPFLSYEEKGLEYDGPWYPVRTTASRVVNLWCFSGHKFVDTVENQTTWVIAENPY
jgi:hypothetical protein